MSSAADISAGDAFVRLTLEDRKYLQGLRNAQQKLLSFGRGVEAWGRTMLKVGATVAATLTAAVAHFVRTGDAIGDMAERTGIAAGKMAEFAYAAEKSESSAEALETALKKMAVQIQALRDGGDGATKMFRELGLGVSDFVGLKPDEQFELIAMRLNQVEDVTKRTALATKIFGKAGTELLPMMRNLNRLRDQARREGLLPSEEAIRDAGSIDDALKRVRATISATTVTIGHAFSPAVLEGLETVRRIAKSTKEWIEQNLGLVRSVGRVGVGLLVVGGAAFALGKAFTFAGSTLGGVEKTFLAVKRVSSVPLRAARSLVGGFGLADRATRSLRSSLRGVELAATRAFAAVRKAAGAAAMAGGHAGRSGLGVAQIGLGLAQMVDSLAGSLVRTAARDGLRVGRLFAQGIGAGLRVTRAFFGAAFTAAAPYAQRAMGHVSRIINREAARWSMVLRPMFAHVPRMARVAFLNAALFVGPLVQKVAAAWQRVQPHAARAARAAVAVWRVASVQMARGLVVAATGAFNRIRAMGMATGRAVGAGIGNVGRGIGGAVSGIAGIVGMLGAGAGGAFGQIAGLLPSVLLLIPAVGALINPFTLLVAAVAGGAYAWTQFSDSGQSAISSVMRFLQPFLDTFKQTWGGISDAIAAGDLMGAASIALAGVRTVLLQGVAKIANALGGVWGDFVGRLGSQILDGNIAGAWGTVLNLMQSKFKPFVNLLLGGWDIVSTVFHTAVDAFGAAWRTLTDVLGDLFGNFTGFFDDGTGGMFESWTAFSEGLVAVFTQAMRAVTTGWEKTVSFLARQMLRNAASGGITGALYSKLLGVDVDAESARKELLQLQRVEGAKKRLLKAEQDLARAQQSGGSFVNEFGQAVTEESAQAQIKEQRRVIASVQKESETGFVEDAANDARESIHRDAESFRGKIDGIDRRNQSRAREAAPELDVSGGQNDVNESVRRAQEELRRKNEEAARKRAEADAAAKADEDDFDSAVGGVPDGDTRRKEVVGSFTAAAFAAMGQGGGFESKLLDLTKEQLKAQYEANKELKRVTYELAHGGGFS